jgi:hypothetical protein
LGGLAKRALQKVNAAKVLLTWLIYCWANTDLLGVESSHGLILELTNDERTNDERTNDERTNDERTDDERTDDERTDDERTDGDRANDERTDARAAERGDCLIMERLNGVIAEWCDCLLMEFQISPRAGYECRGWGDRGTSPHSKSSQKLWLSPTAFLFLHQKVR